MSVEGERSSVVHWYSYALAYERAHPSVRVQVSDQTHATLRKIAKLPPSIGLELERLGCGRNKFARVAWARGAEQLEARFREVLEGCAAHAAPRPRTLDPWGKNLSRPAHALDRTG